MTDDYPERELDIDDLYENHSRNFQAHRQGHLNVSEEQTPRREVHWKFNKKTNQSLKFIARRFEDYLDCASLSSSDSPLRRVTASPFKWVSHRCPGYLREEITLSADVSRSVVVAHRYPSQSEICTICGQLVQYPNKLLPHHTAKRQRQCEFDCFRSLYLYISDHLRLVLVTADPALRMKEKEEEEQASSGFLEQENVLATPDAAGEPLDPIQVFKLMMKRLESERTQTDSGTNELPASTSAESAFCPYQGFLQTNWPFFTP